MPDHAEDLEYPFQHSRATQMLRSGLARAGAERGLSVRGAARELNYKASVVISHMQLGRVPIPLERAADIARVVGLPVREFCLAVLEQRYPDAFAEIASGVGTISETGLAHDLQALAGCPLENLSAEHQRVLREVVAERSPGRRWLSVSELPVMLLLRDMRPQIRDAGLDRIDTDAIRQALAT